MPQPLGTREAGDAGALIGSVGAGASSEALGGPAAPVAPPAAAQVFGPAMAAAEHYARLLAGPAVSRGLIGPREVPRLWERHLLNSAAVAELVPHPSSLVDLGSGAGLPGIVLALLLPDVAVTLLEPMVRRGACLLWGGRGPPPPAGRGGPRRRARRR